MLRWLINKFFPRTQWLFVAIVVSGIFGGFGLYAIYLSRAWSYASDNPEACINCHVMSTEYLTWLHSSHARQVCNDCHVPHQNVFKKYFFKAKDGMRHATIFTLRTEPQAIIMKPEGQRAVMDNCLRCHAPMFAYIESSVGKNHHFTERNCWNCHRDTPHGRVKSLASTDKVMVPLPGTAVPEWLKKLLQE
ncbi:MAG: cytochrome c nitrite reductase small subunit [Bacteroidales bacterium]|nr:cytochrome c nitrite reductase small subunit [Bacteroidales bacterium]